MRLPRSLVTGVVFARFERVGLGLSGAAVHRLLDSAGAPVAYVKSTDSRVPHLCEELRAEATRLEWLHRQGVNVPAVIACETVDGRVWLVTSAVAGAPASDPWLEQDRAGVVDRLAACLRELHALETSGCPFDRSLPIALVEARTRTEAGLVDRSWRPHVDQIVPAAARLDELSDLVRDLGAGDVVVSHGDFCLPNVLVRPDGPTGLVDLGRAGLADRHSDVSDMLRSLRSGMNPQYGEVHAQRFLDVYGRDHLSDDGLRAHNLLDQFFWPVPPVDGSNTAMWTPLLS